MDFDEFEVEFEGHLLVPSAFIVEDKRQHLHEMFDCLSSLTLRVKVFHDNLGQCVAKCRIPTIINMVRMDEALVSISKKACCGVLCR